MAMDVFLIFAAWYGAHLLRFNFEIEPNFTSSIWKALPLIIIAKIAVFYFFSLYRGMWRYTSIDDLFNIIKAAVTSAVIIMVILFFTHGFKGFARSTFILDTILTIVLISSNRLSVRLYFLLFTNGSDSPKDILKNLFIPGNKKYEDIKNLLIIGAGDCGEKIFRELRDNNSLKYKVAGFIDDDIKKVGRRIHGIPIYGTIDDINKIVEKTNAHEALIAIPSATSVQMRNIVEQCKKTGVLFKTLPGMGELINGRVSVKAIRDVAYRDLLGREVIRLEENLIGRYLKDSSVLVTGAGGSIGSELCRQICRFCPDRIVLFERAETPLYEIDLELRKNFENIEIVPLLADICDLQQLRTAFKTYKPQVVFHAAAYKHVPMLEIQPWRAVQNNIIGTRNVLDVTNEYLVDRFVFVSTDKAVRPANIMGASKRVAEMLVQSQNGCSLSQTKFITVRFGNVVGSAGSVIPLFKKQIAEGGPLTVTHPEINRYFMTIPEACQLILQAGSMGSGGETYILDMGKPVKIVDMARDLIRFSGLEPDVDIKIEFTGLRPGEKLYEELITEGEGIVPTHHEKIMVLRGQYCHTKPLNGSIDEIARLGDVQDDRGIRIKLKKMVPEYMPAASEFN